MSIGLQPTTGAPGATPRVDRDGERAGPLAPEERVTLSAAGRRAARALPRPPASTVRWYRAPGRARPPPIEPPRARPVHAAVAAYRRQASAAA